MTDGVLALCIVHPSRVLFTCDSSDDASDSVLCAMQSFLFCSGAFIILAEQWSCAMLCCATTCISRQSCSSFFVVSSLQSAKQLGECSCCPVDLEHLNIAKIMQHTSWSWCKQRRFTAWCSKLCLNSLLPQLGWVLYYCGFSRKHKSVKNKSTLSKEI